MVTSTSLFSKKDRYLLKILIGQQNLILASYWLPEPTALSLNVSFSTAKTTQARGQLYKKFSPAKMGSTESKCELPAPETPQYLKYSHLREIHDPRSPGDVPRTPILELDERAKLIDPRSPTFTVQRTPIYCIPVPEGEDDVIDCNNSENSLISTRKETEGQKNIDENKLEKVGQETRTSCSTLSGSVVISEAESSPEKSQSPVGFSEKGYLIKKSKRENKRRRRKRKKKIQKDEGLDGTQPQENSKEVGNQLSNRRPLATRNIAQLGNESPSMDMLIKNAKKLSVNIVPKPLLLGNARDLSLGKENLAATFTP